MSNARPQRTARVAYSGAVHTATPVDGDSTARLRLADGRLVAEADVVWLPPFDVGSIIALGLNYADHVKELAKELTVTTQDEPLVFLKGPNSLVGHQGATRPAAGRRPSTSSPATSRPHSRRAAAFAADTRPSLRIRRGSLKASSRSFGAGTGGRSWRMGTRRS